MLQRTGRILLAPFFLLSVVIGTMLVIFVVASISVGGWIEPVLARLGYQDKPVLLPAYLGILVFIVIGIAGMATLGGWLIGWPGVIVGPLVSIIAVALIDHW